MHSINRRVIYMLIFCSILTALSSTFFVNLAINDTLTKYLTENHRKRNERIVTYFEEVYKRDLTWSKDSGKELQHEGYMSNYCITLLDSEKNVIWAMDPNEIKAMNEENNMVGGEYKTITLEIRYSSEIVGYIVIGQYEAVLVSEQDKNFINTINQNIAISVLIAIIVSVFISFYFSKQFSNPIKSVSDTSVQLTAGNYSAVVTAKSSVTEISNLIKSINILGNRLAYQDDLRKRLVSDISHEIRTPLNIFQNNLEAMIDGVFPASIERLNNLNDEVIRFGKLLNNLDLLKEFEEEKTVLHFETVSIVEILSTIYNDFMLVARRKEIDMELLIKPGCQYLMQGNRDNLKQVFLNILSNAVKFTERGGKIMIEMSFDKVHLYVTFKDNGIGIRKEDLPFIFERLYRGDKSRNEIEGAGIGLTVVKKIMLLHSATIEVESEEGKGSNFLLRFNR